MTRSTGGMNADSRLRASAVVSADLSKLFVESTNASNVLDRLERVVAGLEAAALSKVLVIDCSAPGLNALEFAAVGDAGRFCRLLARIQHLPCPTLAYTSGQVAGATTAALLAADFVVVGETSEVSWLRGGNHAGRVDAIAAWMTARTVGHLALRRVIFLHKGNLSALSCIEMGIATEIAASPATRCTELALEMVAAPDAAYALTKRILEQSGQSTLDEVFELETAAQMNCLASPAHKALLEERQKPAPIQTQ